MNPFCRAALLAVAGPALVTAVFAQAPAPRSEPSRDSPQEFVPVPANVKAQGLPPIPASIVQDLAPYASSISAARNMDYARMDTAVAETDEIAFLPPVSGGVN